MLTYSTPLSLVFIVSFGACIYYSSCLLPCRQCYLQRVSHLFVFCFACRFPPCFRFVFSSVFFFLSSVQAAKEVADFLGTVHHSFVYTVQEGLDAIREVRPKIKRRNYYRHPGISSMKYTHYTTCRSSCSAHVCTSGRRRTIVTVFACFAITVSAVAPTLLYA